MSDKKSEQDKTADRPADQAADKDSSAGPASQPKSASQAKGRQRSSGDRGQTGANADKGANHKQRPGRAAVAFSLLVAVLALLLSAALATAAWWFWNQYDDHGERVEMLENRLAEQESSLEEAKAQSEAVPSLESRLDELARTVSDDESERQALAEQLERVDQRTEALREFVDAGQSAWVLAEVEYLLRLANTEMQLAGRKDTADAALAAADERLEALADPALTDVRAAIARDRERLRALETVDVSGMVLTLSSLMERVDDLPLAVEQTRAEAEAEAEREEDSHAQRWWRQLQSRGRDVLSDLVTIRHEDTPVRPLLAPEQEYFLRRNLTLSLATARLALMEEEPEVWRASLAEARDWLGHYFDADDRQVASMDESLVELADQSIRRERPDLSSGLDRLRAIREARD